MFASVFLLYTYFKYLPNYMLRSGKMLIRLDHGICTLRPEDLELHLAVQFSMGHPFHSISFI